MSQIFPSSIDFDQVMYNPNFKNANAYERYLGRIKLIEYPPDIQSKPLYTESQQTLTQ